MTVSLRERSFETCRYLDEWTGASTEAGEEGQDSIMVEDGVVGLEGADESSRERLPMSHLGGGCSGEEISPGRSPTNQLSC